MQHPLEHLDTDLLEQTVETITHTVGDIAHAVGDLGESFGETFVDDVVPVARTTARRTTRVVRGHPKTSLATVVGIVALIGFVLWWRGRDDDPTDPAS